MKLKGVSKDIYNVRTSFDEVLEKIVYLRISYAPLFKVSKKSL